LVFKSIDTNDFYVTKQYLCTSCPGTQPYNTNTVFPAAAQTAPGATMATLQYSGGLVAAGQKTHTGADFTVAGTPGSGVEL
jgi:hypothetical protein